MCPNHHGVHRSWPMERNKVQISWLLFGFNFWVASKAACSHKSGVSLHSHLQHVAFRKLNMAAASSPNVPFAASFGRTIERCFIIGRVLAFQTYSPKDLVSLLMDIRFLSIESICTNRLRWPVSDAINGYLILFVSTAHPYDIRITTSDSTIYCSHRRFMSTLIG